VLHEAVLLGSEADSIIKILIDFGANPKWKNNKNETVSDHILIVRFWLVNELIIFSCFANVSSLSSWR